jgi:hypothetical protein
MNSFTSVKKNERTSARQKNKKTQKGKGEMSKSTFCPDLTRITHRAHARHETMFACLFVSLSVCLSACLFVCLSVNVSFCMYVCLSRCVLYIYLTIYIYMYMYIYTHMYMHIMGWKPKEDPTPLGHTVQECWLPWACDIADAGHSASRMRCPDHG